MDPLQSLREYFNMSNGPIGASWPVTSQQQPLVNPNLQKKSKVISQDDLYKQALAFAMQKLAGQ